MQRDEYAGPLALRAMQSLAVRAFPATGYRHAGDLAWNWCLALDRAEHCPTAVWSDGGRAVAWGWLELPDGLMLQVDPERPELVRDVLDWAEATAGTAGSGPLSVEVADTERAVIEALELREYVRETGGPGGAPATGPYMTCLGRPLTGGLQGSPPSAMPGCVRPGRTVPSSTSSSPPPAATSWPTARAGTTR
ncbi:hypothetical protein ACH4GK_00215 [Streptomyces rimosus]|uniref:hypothetical protein n=1 Tax=Streptomyces rimosus TaxID=1927 RepID=UPI000A89E77A|nr:hypothetical protein [Streptomyces rimosus]